MSREIHLMTHRPDHAACGVVRQSGEFYSSTSVKDAVTCLDCQKTQAYAHALRRYSLTGGSTI